MEPKPAEPARETPYPPEPGYGAGGWMWGRTPLPGRAVARLVLPLLLAAAVATGLAGCGGSSDPLTAVSAAARTSLSEAFIASLTLTGAQALGATSSQQLLAKGVFDRTQGLAYERVDLPGALDKNKRPPRDFLIFLSTKILLTPATQVALPAGKSVISVPLAGLEATARSAAPFVEQAMGLNPQLLLDEIVRGGVAASRTGSEVVGHVPFVDYRVTVDLPRALAGASGPFARAERLAIKAELASLASGQTRVHIAVRVDGAGFVRALQAIVPGSKLGALAIELSGYGAKFVPSYPPKAQIVPLASLTGSKAWTAQSPWVFART
jgi:hypothetical protein